VETTNTGKQREASAEDSASDLLWGVAAIGREIDRTPAQTYHLIQIGALEGAVAKLGHRTIVGSRKRLANLISNKIKAA
jgi:hypothetical protein